MQIDSVLVETGYVKPYEGETKGVLAEKPKIISVRATPSSVTNDGKSKVLIEANVSSKKKLKAVDIGSDLINKTAAGWQWTSMWDDGTHGDKIANNSVYSYEFTIAKGSVPKTYTIGVTAENEAGTAVSSTTLEVTGIVPSKPQIISATASPSTIPNNDSPFLLKVQVEPKNVTVKANLHVFGSACRSTEGIRPCTEQETEIELRDDCGKGSASFATGYPVTESGDETAGDGIFTAKIYAGKNLTAGKYSIPVNASNEAGSATASINLEITQAECSSDDGCAQNQVCINAKCEKAELVISFVPVNYDSSSDYYAEAKKMGDYIKNIFLKPTPLGNCLNKVRINIRPWDYWIGIPFQDLSITGIYPLGRLSIQAWEKGVVWDYLVGLTDDDLKILFGTMTAGGYASSAVPNVVLVGRGSNFVAAHELGHAMAGLKDEYCDCYDTGCNVPSIGPGSKCGFKVQPNPLSPMYGCPTVDLDDDSISDCCWCGLKYDACCYGNVGLSETEKAKSVFEKGVYDILSRLKSNVNKMNQDISNEEITQSVNQVISDMILLNNTLNEIGMPLSNFVIKQEWPIYKLPVLKYCLKSADVKSCLNKKEVIIDGGSFSNEKGIKNIVIDFLKDDVLDLSMTLNFTTSSLMAGVAGKKVELDQTSLNWINQLERFKCDYR